MRQAGIWTERDEGPWRRVVLLDFTPEEPRRRNVAATEARRIVHVETAAPLTKRQKRRAAGKARSARA